MKNRASVFFDKFVWHATFSWWPVRTMAGNLRWLATLERRWNNDLNHWCHEGYSGADGGWEYRLPLRKVEYA